MSETKKFININENVLIEWIYNNGNVSEDYSIWTDLKTQKRNFVSKSNNNKIDYSLFNIDPVLKKYSKVDFNKFNFLKNQDYFTSPIQYDKVNINFPFNYDFGEYVGFLFQAYTYDFQNKKLVYFSNYFYDKTDINIEKLMQLKQPFRYGEKEWGKYLTISIPSLDEISNQRLVNSTFNKPIEDSINYNITSNKVGLSLTSPIFIDFSFITTRETILGTTYYYLGDTFNTSISKTPEYQSLGVTIEESKEWDFFIIYGFYNNSNENLDNFVRELEERGRRINIEYIITLYEENIQSGFSLKFSVSENFSQKIEYRPIFKYSNTTASIDVEMHVIDLVDNSTIIRNTSLGLTKNLFKYGKKLSRLQINSLTKPKIYNYSSDNTVNMNANLMSVTNYGITKVPYPLLVSNYKILVSNSRNQSDISDYKPLGNLTILLTPFDNIIKFQIAKQISAKGTAEPYNMSELLNNAKLTLIFRSDNQMVEKGIFLESDENNFEYGVVIFKIPESDMKIIKKIKDIDNNFYLTIVANQNRTLLYSGKYKIYEDVRFLDTSQSDMSSSVMVNTTESSETTTSETTIKADVTPNKKLPTLKDKNKSKSSSNIKKTYIDEKVDKNDPFKEENLIDKDPIYINELDNYVNVILYLNPGLTKLEKNSVKINLENLGVSIYYQYKDTMILQRVDLNKLKRIEEITYVQNVIRLKLNLGWDEIKPPPPIPDNNTIINVNLSTAAATGVNNILPPTFTSTTTFDDIGFGGHPSYPAV